MEDDDEVSYGTLVGDGRAKRAKRWSSAETATLALLHARHGNCWVFLAKHLRGRTDNDIKNIFHSTLRGKSAVAQSNAHTLLLSYVQAVGASCEDPEARRQAYEAARQAAAAAGVSTRPFNSTSRKQAPASAVGTAAGAAAGGPKARPGSRRRRGRQELEATSARAASVATASAGAAEEAVESSAAIAGCGRTTTAAAAAAAADPTRVAPDLLGGAFWPLDQALGGGFEESGDTGGDRSASEPALAWALAGAGAGVGDGARRYGTQIQNPAAQQPGLPLQERSIGDRLMGPGPGPGPGPGSGPGPGVKVKVEAQASAPEAGPDWGWSWGRVERWSGTGMAEGGGMGPPMCLYGSGALCKGDLGDLTGPALGPFGPGSVPGPGGCAYPAAYSAPDSPFPHLSSQTHGGASSAAFHAAWRNGGGGSAMVREVSVPAAPVPRAGAASPYSVATTARVPTAALPLPQLPSLLTAPMARVRSWGHMDVNDHGNRDGDGDGGNGGGMESALALETWSADWDLVLRESDSTSVALSAPAATAGAASAAAVSAGAGVVAPTRPQPTHTPLRPGSRDVRASALQPKLKPKPRGGSRQYIVQLLTSSQAPQTPIEAPGPPRAQPPPAAARELLDVPAQRPLSWPPPAPFARASAPASERARWAAAGADWQAGGGGRDGGADSSFAAGGGGGGGPGGGGPGGGSRDGGADSSFAWPSQASGMGGMGMSAGPIAAAAVAGPTSAGAAAAAAVAAAAAESWGWGAATWQRDLPPAAAAQGRRAASAAPHPISSLIPSAPTRSGARAGSGTTVAVQPPTSGDRATSAPTLAWGSGREWPAAAALAAAPPALALSDPTPFNGTPWSPPEYDICRRTAPAPAPALTPPPRRPHGARLQILTPRQGQPQPPQACEEAPWALQLPGMGAVRPTPDHIQGLGPVMERPAMRQPPPPPYGSRSGSRSGSGAAVHNPSAGPTVGLTGPGRVPRASAGDEDVSMLHMWNSWNATMCVEEECGAAR
ncbi:hypothetical protein HYH03_014511 [Edaphochlamys debaryana]|uniref:Uncharacterized protein n=1 Tax=Edaphochlamys debaryana TaxID=47281 RepID=A0A835XMJ5_9CHLO|nr:hypothetical protein HYH03_014511 [Edaphochlamys debaryana]|eukprot:KAG2486828.1 hypothetical protein HYH03_014511 [Edaphochlamys debaryana]